MNKESRLATKLTALAFATLSLNTLGNAVYASRCAAFGDTRETACFTGSNGAAGTGRDNSVSYMETKLPRVIQQGIGPGHMDNDITTVHGDGLQFHHAVTTWQESMHMDHGSHRTNGDRRPGSNTWSASNNDRPGTDTWWSHGSDTPSCNDQVTGRCENHDTWHGDREDWFRTGRHHGEKFTGRCTRYGSPPPSAVPVPAAIWLFGSGLIGLVGVARRWNA